MRSFQAPDERFFVGSSGKEGFPVGHFSRFLLLKPKSGPKSDAVAGTGQVSQRRPIDSQSVERTFVSGMGRTSSA